MKPSLAVAAVEFLFEKHAPHLVEQGWKVMIHTRNMRRLGLCHYTHKTLYLAESFVLLNDPKEVEKTGIHEIAHALVGPGHGHGPIWKAQARALGIKPERCNTTATVAPGKFQATCPNPTCGKVYPFYRKPKDLMRSRWCRTCGPVRGPLTVLPTAAQTVAVSAATDYDGDTEDLDSLLLD